MARAFDGRAFRILIILHEYSTDLQHRIILTVQVCRFVSYLSVRSAYLAVNPAGSFVIY